jgi:hypothetical protein
MAPTADPDLPPPDSLVWVETTTSYTVICHVHGPLEAGSYSELGPAMTDRDDHLQSHADHMYDVLPDGAPA